MIDHESFTDLTGLNRQCSDLSDRQSWVHLKMSEK